MNRHNARVGVGLKNQHLNDILGGSRVDIDFFEVHAENYMSAGGPMPARLHTIRKNHELSIHGVGLSIGGCEPLDAAHLARLKTLVKRFEPRWFSEHLAWSSHGGNFYNDLLPLPYTRETLLRVCNHIDQVQHTLGQRMLLENPSSYLAFEETCYDEADFIIEVQRRTGCALLLDVNNAFVSAINQGSCARRFIDALPHEAIQEIHLAGFAEDLDAAGDRLLIDTHGSAIAPAVWSLYEYTLARTGAVPTLIERDNSIPSFITLQEEALTARRVMCANFPGTRMAA